MILKGDPTGDISTLDVKDDPNLKVLSWIVEHCMLSAFVKLKVITQLLVSLVKFIKLREYPSIGVVFSWPPTTTTFN